MDFRRFLLYTKAQEQAFRVKYAAHLHLLPKYEEWFYTFPLYEWHKIQVPLRSAEFVIGMLCLLTWEGRAQFSFRFPDALDCEALIQREARNREEFDNYMDKIFKKPAQPQKP